MLKFDHFTFIGSLSSNDSNGNENYFVIIASSS